MRDALSDNFVEQRSVDSVCLRPNREPFDGLRVASELADEEWAPARLARDRLGSPDPLGAEEREGKIAGGRGRELFDDNLAHLGCGSASEERLQQRARLGLLGPVARDQQK